MAYTLGTAAKATGKSKTSIRRALDRGLISGEKTEGGEWRIEPSELHRVFPAVTGGTGTGVTPEETPRNTLLQADLDAAHREMALLRELLDREREISRGLEQDRDHWRQQATALLSDQRGHTAPQKPAEGRLSRAWAVLRGEA
jgi:hypothetical protein